jgi:phage terminase large subunit-like protein
VSDWNGIPEDWGKGHYRDVPICKWARLARERQVRDLKRAAENDPTFPYYYDDEAADRVVKFFSKLRLYDGEWADQPFILSDWQEWDLLRPLFGWKKRSNNLRRFRRGDILIPKKNGKTPLAAGIGAYMFIADQEPGARVICGASKEEQAMEVWNAAKKMLLGSPELRQHVTAFKKSLFNSRLQSSFIAIGRDSETSDGPSVHCGLLDETHAHRNRDIIDIIDNALGARRQPLVLCISTLGVIGPSPVWHSLKYGQKILQRIVDNEEQFFYFTTVDDPKKWDDPIEWQKANPNLEISIYTDGFLSDFAAVKDFPEKQNKFKCKRLNIPVEQASRWIPMERWDKCGGPLPLEQLKGRRCFGGFDMGINKDISALALAFQFGEIEVEGLLLPLIWLMMRYWVPEVGLQERYQRDRVDYPLWADRGWITTTPGETTRPDIIRRDINALAREYEIAEIAMDKAHCYELMKNLSDDDLTVVDHSQTLAAMTFPCRSMEKLILDSTLRHGDDDVLRWMASNVAVLIGGDDRIKIIKDKSADRVDGMVAAVMAVGRLLIAPAPERFIYNEIGMYCG